MTFLQRLWADIGSTAGTFRQIFTEHPLQGIVLVVSLLAGLGGALYEEYKTQRQQQQRRENQSYTSQLASLNSVEANLNDLLAFVSEQKLQLKRQEDALNRLEEERSKLKPLLDADRETIEALFQVQAEKQKASVWIDRTIGFLLGIAGSLVATAIWTALRRARSNKQMQVTQ